MATELFAANRATTAVSSGGTDAPPGGTVEMWTVVSSAMFGAAVTSVSQFHVADPAAPSEIIAVTAVSGTTWTVTRGAESTTPVTHSAGFTVYQVTTAGWLGSLLSVLTPSGDTSGATDYAAIFAALSANKIVFLMGGIFYTNTTIIPTGGSQIEGIGYAATTLKAANGSNLIAVIAEDAYYNNRSGPQAGSVYRNMTIDGNKSNQTTYGPYNTAGGYGLIMSSVRSTVEGCYFQNHPVDGWLMSDANKAGSTYSAGIIECHIENNYADSNGRHGFRVTDVDQTYGCTDSYFQGNVAINNGGWGGYLENVLGWFVRDNHAWVSPLVNAGIGSWYMKNIGTSTIDSNEADLFGNPGAGARTVADAVFNSTTVITSATAAFGFGDIGATVSGSGVQAGTTIVSVQSATQATLSLATTTSGSGKTVTFTPNYYGFWFDTIRVARPSVIIGNVAATPEYQTTANYYYYTVNLEQAVAQASMVFEGNAARRDKWTSGNNGAISVAYSWTVTDSASVLTVNGTSNQPQDGILTTLTTAGAGQLIFTDATPGVSISAMLSGDINGMQTLPGPEANTDYDGGPNYVSGVLYLGFCTNYWAASLSAAKFYIGGTGASGLTLAQIGLFSVNPVTGTLTLVGETADLHAVFNSAGTYAALSETFTAVGGGTFTPVVGQRYAIGILQVGTTPASLQYANNGVQATGVRPRKSARLTGQSSLPSTIADASLADFSVLPWIALN